MTETDQHSCKDCGYFRQHYILKEEYQAIYYGHCVHPPRSRNCRPDMPACPKWIPKPEDSLVP